MVVKCEKCEWWYKENQQGCCGCSYTDELKALKRVIAFKDEVIAELEKELNVNGKCNLESAE